MLPPPPRERHPWRWFGLLAVWLLLLLLLTGASAATAACAPAIALTSVPAYATFDNLHGTATCVDPATHRVVLAIDVGGWWTKPTFAAALTPIQPDGRWSADITTGGSDHLATAIFAALLPATYDPPLLAGAAALPTALLADALAFTHVNRSARTLDFAGRTWHVKRSSAPVGPGPNQFSDADDDVWVDADGRLHLTIRRRGDVWTSTEVFTHDALGIGEYRFQIDSPLALYDPNIVVGLFTWHSVDPRAAWREIDIEFSRWGVPAAGDGQFVVQPWSLPGNRHRFASGLDGGASTHRFNWSADRITFESHAGVDAGGAPIAAWTYRGASIPPDGAVNARINFWLVNGQPPTDGQAAELIVRAFDFTPPAPTAVTHVGVAAHGAPVAHGALAAVIGALTWAVVRRPATTRPRAAACCTAIC